MARSSSRPLRSISPSHSTAAPVAGGRENIVRSRLANGLSIVLHQDRSTPIVTINVLYHVGSKNEAPGSTGFAHLFEHLMFDGSRHVERGGYDRLCTSVGGDNNAFTTSDITSYYISLPSDHLPLGLWLEADRMAGFAIEEISLTTQKNVVSEERRQTVDDAPFGDLAEVMRDVSYGEDHPYRWETIGSMEDIASATMQEVRSFYERHYHPANAVLVVAGDFEFEEASRLVEGYFGGIAAAPSGTSIAPGSLRYGVRRRVDSTLIPFNGVFLGYHLPSIHHPDFYALDALASILSEGESSRLYRSLEYELEIASEADCFIDDGELGSLLYLYAIGQNKRISAARLEEALRVEVDLIFREGVNERELQKVKNRKLTRIAHSLQSVSSRAERLAYFTSLFDDPSLAFREADLYESVTVEDILRVARTYLESAAPNVVEYRRKVGR